MLSFLPGPIKGALSFFFIGLNTLFIFALIVPFALLKLAIPTPGFRKVMNAILDWVSTLWITINGVNLRVFNRIEWKVEGLEGLSTRDWFLVICNHQSWADILILQKIFNHRIPFLKFFLKQELIWVPVIGLAWWAIDYPFMKRYTAKEIERRPELKGKDLETTRKACEKFRLLPVSIMNFVEGTRFTVHKHDAQQSPYKHLLKPKAAGIAFVLAAMGKELNSILDVTIHYPGGIKSIWEFLCGKAPEVRVKIKRMVIGSELRGDYFNDEKFRAGFQRWLNDLWSEKDRMMENGLA